jgi:HEAT repeat protein
VTLLVPLLLVVGLRLSALAEPLDATSAERLVSVQYFEGFPVVPRSAFGEEAVTHLIRLLSERADDPVIRRNVAMALGMSGDSLAYAPLVALQRTAEDEGDVRTSLAGILALGHLAAVHPPAVSYLKHVVGRHLLSRRRSARRPDEKTVGRMAVTGLGISGHPVARHVLVALAARAGQAEVGTSEHAVGALTLWRASVSAGQTPDSGTVGAP